MDNNTLTAYLQAARARRILSRLLSARGPGLRLAFGQNRQHLRPFIRDGDGVLDVRRGPAVEGDDRPTVREGLRPVRAHVDHRLDGEDVARTDFDAGARLSVVRDLRVFVHFSPDAVADVVAHHAVAVSLCVRLHGPADVAQVLARPALPYGPLQALHGHADQLQPVLAHAADGHGRRRVADVAGERHAAVNREDVAFLQHVGGGEAVDDLLVDGGADREGEAVVALEGRQRPGVADHLLRGHVEFERGDAGTRHAAQLLAHLRHEPPGGPHLLDLFFRLPDYHSLVNGER